MKDFAVALQYSSDCNEVASSQQASCSGNCDGEVSTNLNASEAMDSDHMAGNFPVAVGTNGDESCPQYLRN